MSADPSHWVGRLTGWCFSILAAAIALSYAIKIIICMWPALAEIVGTVALFVMIFRIVVYYTSQKF